MMYPLFGLWWLRSQRYGRETNKQTGVERDKEGLVLVKRVSVLARILAVISNELLLQRKLISQLTESL